MKLIYKCYAIVIALLNQPLSLLRFLLSILLGKKLIEQLYFINEVVDNTRYQLATTWFTRLLPDTWFVFNDSHVSTILILIIVVAIAAAIGFLGRLSLFTLAFLSYYIFGISEGIGIFDHHMSLPTQVILALALVPGSMKLSIDYLLLKYVYLKEKTPLFQFSKNPKWGFNLVLALVVLTYFTAGVSKLRYGHGVNWLDGSTLGFYLKERTNLYKQGDVQLIIGDAKIAENKKWKDEYGFIAHTYANYQISPRLTAIAEYVANKKILLILLSIGSVLFELLAFIAFINSKYRNIYLVAAIIFHLSIGALMGISFRQYRIICLFLIDWVIIFEFILKKIKSIKSLRINKT
ncbi:hypothetical protein ACFQ1R_00885 [Mariniflexile jejuense]|uniref:HTTM domain-containing protein n=1 Tax=Mariniflexile jejuense TaxID=1173582 RepID=A0ABW3JEF0_9FLAO